MPQSSLFGALILLNIHMLETLMCFIMMYGNFFQMKPEVFQYVWSNGCPMSPCLCKVC